MSKPPAPANANESGTAEATPRRMERRQHPRGRFPAEAVLLADGRRVGRFAVRNLSAGGALLSGGAHLSANRRVELLLGLPGRHPIRLLAQVIRIEVGADGTPAMAVAFHNVQPDVEDCIQSYVLSALDAGVDCGAHPNP